jgi:hypothetical protein
LTIADNAALYYVATTEKKDKNKKQAFHNSRVSQVNKTLKTEFHMLFCKTQKIQHEALLLYRLQNL